MERKVSSGTQEDISVSKKKKKKKMVARHRHHSWHGRTRKDSSPRKEQ